MHLCLLTKSSTYGDEVQENEGRKNNNRCLKIVVARMDRRSDAEDEGFKTFETPEVSGTWRQRYTAFNPP